MLPSLDEPYSGALREALAYIHHRYAPDGILVSGTIIRGTPHLASDLDFVVIHPHHWRQRTQCRFNGVPGEMFVNPPFELERAFHRDATSGRPIMPHMVATGVILHDPDDALAGLQQLAREVLANGPTCSSDDLLLRRYAIASAFEDAQDIAELDPERSAAFATEAILSAVRLLFLVEGRWIPREKDLLSELGTLHPEWSEVVRASLQSASVPERLGLASPFIEHVAGATGFFEWESAPQPRTP